MPDPSPAQRKFTSPLSRGNVVVPQPRRPIPKRDQPLPGTKLPNIPAKHTPGFRLSFETAPFSDSGDRLARVFGWLSLITASVLLTLLILGAMGVSWLPDIHAMWIILGFALIHAFAIFSQIASDGRCAGGRIALWIFWLGLGVIMVIAAVVQWIMN